MGRFASLVDTLEGREAFKARYNIPVGVTIENCELGEWYTKAEWVCSYPHDSLYRWGDEDPYGWGYEGLP